MGQAEVILGRCEDVLPGLPGGTYDVVLCDPPYPMIKRSYGTWTEAEWWALMRAVVPECMRVLKPTGSAVFILQPNSERLGRMRTWLWEFMLWVGKEWGIVQDAYWWNYAALPEAHAIQGKLLRPSLKHCVWAGQSGCWRDQDAVLWQESDGNRLERVVNRTNAATRKNFPSGQGVTRERMGKASERRGGVTPFNVFPCPNTQSIKSAGAYGHGAGTPHRLCEFWLRYLCPPGGSVLDPFAGSGTVSVAATSLGLSSTAVEVMPEYVTIARRRIAEAQGPLFAGKAAV